MNLKAVVARRPPVAPTPSSSWQAGYLRLLPDIDRQARRALRHLHSEALEDVLQEVIADTAVIYRRLAEIGRAELAYPTPLVNFAVRKHYAGRRVGNRMNANDVSSAYCQRKRRITIERLDRFDATSDEWREVLVADQRATPAEIAAMRIDFDAWLKSLTPRDRSVAKTLATGETTRRVASMFNLTAGRVSQLRQELRSSWLAFINDASRGASKLGTCCA